MVGKKGRSGVRRKKPVSRRKPLAKNKYARKRLGPKLGTGTITLKSYGANDPFPPMCMKTMTYAATHQLHINNAIGTANFSSEERVWKLNSPVDPYVGITPSVLNTSAYGMTEMASLYNRYKVFGVLVEIQFFDPNEDGLVAGVLFNNPSNGSNQLLNSSIGSVEKKPQGWTSSLANTGSQKLNFRQYYPMHQLFNLTKSQYANDIENTTSGTASDPATNAWVNICMADSNARANTDLYMQYTIRLTYYTQFYQRKQYS